VPTSATELINRTRRLLRDFPVEDSISASVSSSAGTLSTNYDATVYTKNMLIEIESELMRVVSDGSGTSVTVNRGVRGSTAASHASGSSILRAPAFYAVEILDALNEGIQATYPLLYKPFTNEYTGIAADTYEYQVPTMTSPAVPIPHIHRIQVKVPGDLAFREKRDWVIIRGATPFIKFRSPPDPNSTVRIEGFGPFPLLTSTSSTLDSLFPVQAEYLPCLYAAAVLLSSGEAGRSRADTGVRDDRESANRVGASAALSRDLEGRFARRLSAMAMPPMSRHVISTSV
jgi:hypothetical protein